MSLSHTPYDIVNFICGDLVSSEVGPPLISQPMSYFKKQWSGSLVTNANMPTRGTFYVMFKL